MLRESGNNVPVLILSASIEQSAKVQGLKMGADDYVTKPFSVTELSARIEAVLRRSKRPDGGQRGDRNGSVLRFADIVIDTKTHEVTKNGVRLNLSPMEYKILLKIYEPGVHERIALLNECWGMSGTGLRTRTLDTHIYGLREKLEDDPKNPKLIVTVRKTGYRLDREHA
jgi:DNA-binding response OmpR family regulator